MNQAPTRAAAPLVYQSAMGLPQNDVVTPPPDPIQEEPTYQAALNAFEAPGVSAVIPDVPGPGHDRALLVFRTGRDLNDNAPAASGTDRYTSNAGALPLADYSTNTGAGGLCGNASQWQWNWQHNPSGSAVSYTSAPLTTTTTVIGGGAVHVWVSSATPDVDLQARVSEVRPDRNETFVQNGWLRASERKLATTSDNIFKQPSTALEPIPTFLASDVQPMPSGQLPR